MTSGAVPEDALRIAFERRAARAEQLAETTPPAREPLRFGAGLYRAQGRVAAGLAERHRRQPLAGSLEGDGPALVAALPELWDFLIRHAPAPLAEQAKARAGDEVPAAQAQLDSGWAAGGSTLQGYLSRASLRPYVECLAALGLRPARTPMPRRCPFCAGPPWIASLRSEGEQDGAARRLGCALCGQEWPVSRIWCAGCGEEDPRRLPAFQSEKHPGVRLQACESCRHYVKAIDLSLDLRPIPEVDDLVSLGMDLWAADQGYTRLEPGLAGL